MSFDQYFNEFVQIQHLENTNRIGNVGNAGNIIEYNVVFPITLK